MLESWFLLISGSKLSAVAKHWIVLLHYGTATKVFLGCEFSGGGEFESWWTPFFFWEWQQDLVFIKIIYHSFILIHLDLILGLLGKLWKLLKALLAGEAFCQIERSSHSWNVCVEDYLAFVFKLITPQSQSNIHNSQTIFTCHSYIICMCIVYDIFR